MNPKTYPLDSEGLLTRHGISSEEFKMTKLQWPLIEEICADHHASSAELHTAANYFSQRLQQAPRVHSLKVRLKDPEHLAAKMIRKKLEHPELEFDMESYQERITDLIGLRALHLFKDEWRPIHEFVTKTWELGEPPIAYVRLGDPEHLLKDLSDAGCTVTTHPFGYRSIHYLLKSQPEKRTYTAELQVRTIFEEGWSEIDHRVRYPRHSDDAYLKEYLAIFNRLSGMSDEMGTFIKNFSAFARTQTQKLTERDRQISQKEAELKKAISELRISKEEKNSLEKQIEELRKSTQGFSIFDDTTNTGFTNPLAGLGEFGLGGVLQQRCSVCGRGYNEVSYTLGPFRCSDCRNVQTCMTCHKQYKDFSNPYSVWPQCPECLSGLLKLTNP